MTEAFEALAGKFVECRQAPRSGIRMRAVGKAGQHALELCMIEAVSVSDNRINGGA